MVGMSIFNQRFSTHTPRLEASSNGEHADLYLYGVIGDWWDGNTIEDILNRLESKPNLKTITVYLSSIGGGFFDGLPIYNTLQQHNAHVTVKIMGYAVSMASVIMLAANHIEIAQNGLIMIHRAQGWQSGDADEMRKHADVLEKHEQAIIPRYAERMSLDKEAVLELLKAETWYTADEAQEAGLVDAITDAVDLDQQNKNTKTNNQWQTIVNSYKHPPPEFNQPENKRPWLQSLIAATIGEAPTPSIPDADTTDDELNDMTPELKTELAELIRNAVREEIKNQTPVPAPEPEPTPEPPAATPEPTNQADANTQDNDAAQAVSNADLLKEIKNLKTRVQELEGVDDPTPTPSNLGDALYQVEQDKRY